MLSSLHFGRLLLAAVVCAFATTAGAQSFRVQCPSSTTMHAGDTSGSYTGPTAALKTFTRKDGTTYTVNYINNGGGIKCQQISGGDGYATMADGHPTYLFGFGPLSGLADLAKGLPGTQKASDFNQSNLTSAGAVSSSVFIGAPVDQSLGTLNGYSYNGAIGLVPDQIASTFDANGNVVLNCSLNANVANPACLDGHVEPRLIMDVGVMNANQPAPLMAIDEDDEFFLTLTNVGMIMRPDLFEQHTVHFHGYPNASSFYDGVPDASIAISIGGSFSYYYLAPDAGTYFWHCHISPPEHLQMGMVGQLYVRPRQNRVPAGGSLYLALAGSAPVGTTTVGTTPATVVGQQSDLRTACRTEGILCSTPVPPADSGAMHGTNKSNTPTLYAYNDGDGSTAYDVEYPIQMHGFDPNFHFVGMTFNPESFTDMKDKYFMLNGRSYPDTVQQGTMTTPSVDGTLHASQPVPTLINIPAGGRALLRISSLSVTEYFTLASLGVPMTVIGINARLLRDLAGNNLAYQTNSITMAGGESMDVILDAKSLTAGQKFYLYTPNLDHLSNDAENFGGMMTEVNICNAVDPATKACS